MAPKVNPSMKEQYADDSPNAGSGHRSIPTTADEPANTDAGMSGAAQGGGNPAGNNNQQQQQQQDKHPSGAPKAYEVQKNSDKYGAVVGGPEYQEEGIKSKL